MGFFWFIEFGVLKSFIKFLGLWDIKIENDIRDYFDIFIDKSMEEEDVLY